MKTHGLAAICLSHIKPCKMFKVMDGDKNMTQTDFFPTLAWGGLTHFDLTWERQEKENMTVLKSCMLGSKKSW